MRAVTVHLDPLGPTDADAILVRGLLQHAGLDGSWLAATDLVHHLRTERAEGRAWAAVGRVGPSARGACLVIGTELDELEPGCLAEAGDTELSYWTLPSHRGRGVTRTVVERAVSLWSRPGTALVAHTTSDNRASTSILRRAGRLRAEHGGHACFSLTRTEAV